MAQKKPTSVRVTEGGKAAYIRRLLPSGDVQDVCVCYYNADFSTGCIANIRNSDLAEVIENRGTYVDVHRKLVEYDGELAVGCEYCYARPDNQRNIIPKAVTTETVNDLESIARNETQDKRRIIRLGKMTECGDKLYRETLYDFIEACVDLDLRVILPTKHLEFDPKVADLFKATDSALNYSIVGDFLEQGSVGQGHTQAARIQRAQKYYAEGVRTSLTLTADFSASIEFNEERGFTVYDALNAVDATGITLRLLPMHFSSKKVALKATGRTWEYLLGQVSDGMFQSISGDFIRGQTYKRRTNRAVLDVMRIHPDWQEILDRFKDDVGACSKMGDLEFCDYCNLTAGVNPPKIVFPQNELAPPPIRVNGKKRAKKEKKSNPEQMLLELPILNND